MIIGVGASRRRLKFAALDTSSESVRTWAEFMALDEADRSALLAIRMAEGRELNTEYVAAIIATGQQLDDWSGRNDALVLSPGFITHDSDPPTLVVLAADGPEDGAHQEMRIALVVEVVCDTRPDGPVSADVARALDAAAHWQVDYGQQAVIKTVIDDSRRPLFEGLRINPEIPDD